MLDHEAGQAGHAADAELAHDALTMCLDGPGRDAQLIRDPSVGLPSSHQDENLDLAGSEGIDPTASLLLLELLAKADRELLGDTGAEVLPSLVHRGDRSAQLGGCEPCMNARKVDDVTEEVVACLISPSLRSDLTVRERRALEFLDLLATDHHKIDDEVYRGLAEVFTTAEIVELGSTCGHMIGTHRFLHTLDPYGDAPPVIRFDPAQVGVTWAELHDGKLEEQGV